jgi:oxygen-independent coproporphyrinogen-3 oxidase
VIPLQQVQSITPARDKPDLRALLDEGRSYLAYTYSYPHKTAYRPFEARPLDEVWAAEDRSALFLYLHVPFCEMRCGFCNLFTQARPGAELPVRYLDALERQARRVRSAVGEHARFSRVAIGGGTPTQLERPLLERLFDVSEKIMGADLAALPVSLETSPETADDEKLDAVIGRGIDRLSMGVQSFSDDELKALGRPLRGDAAERALDRIRARDFRAVNVDLIYGIAGQTTASFLASVERALRWSPEELYLYPLYVRPLTGLGRRDRSWRDGRREMVTAARDLLRANGYEQVSLRMYRRREAETEDGPVYCCQDDGMVGLGCGARSYTSELHYSDEYAVAKEGVREILHEWVERGDDVFGSAFYGTTLDEDEQRRRWVVKSLLRSEGLDLDAYAARFGGEAMEQLPQLVDIEDHGLGAITGRTLALNDEGMLWSDALGPWLYSEAVWRAMGDFELR